MNQRKSGVLLHITSLPSPHGIGTLGQAAYDFVDFLSRADLRIWQILPLVPTGWGNSPYSSICAGAFNPYLIDLDLLVKQGFLRPEDIAAHSFGSDPRKVDFDAVAAAVLPLLRKAFLTFSQRGWDTDFQRFLRIGKYRDFALFATIKEHSDYACWIDWEDSLRSRDPDALRNVETERSQDVAFWQWTQYVFLQQWRDLRAYAAARGIRIMGDMPLYVSYDSAEVWAHKEMFLLDETHKPTLVAGVPPDYFSEDGQLWGNPLYDWNRMREDGYQWWNRRIGDAFELFDILRIDHFRGLDRYYAVPADALNARKGEWLDGPKFELFCGKTHLDIVAEDLGTIDEGVRDLIRQTGFAGMRVMEFGLDGNCANDHKPSCYDPRKVAYTGTHDNMPLMGFLREADEKELATLTDDLAAECRFAGIDAPDCENLDAVADTMIELLYASAADRIVIPMQDLLKSGKESRMNLPGTVSADNWAYRIVPQDLRDDLARTCAELARKYLRSPDSPNYPALCAKPRTGAEYTRFVTRFGVWSPTAHTIDLCVYAKGEGDALLKILPMSKDEADLWTAHVGGNLDGFFYTFRADHGAEVPDPCAKACGINSLRSMVVDLRRTDPRGWKNDRYRGNPFPIVWETHVRDFSIDPELPVPTDLKGKYGGFMRGIRTKQGHDALVDYLIRLGITYVQLQPVNDFCSVDETDRGARNWGYDPHLYNVPEGSYSCDPYDGATRIRELKELILTLHKAGIGVILDVVYNHTYYSEKSVFEQLAPDCYYRKNNKRFLNASGCGNEIASEHPRVRDFILDSVLYWAEEYHVDGFRFDLMGCLDVDTVNTIRARLDELGERNGKTYLTYGEPWTALPVAPWVKPANSNHLHDLDERVGVFNNAFRDGLRGSNAPTRGYIQGDKHSVPAVIAGIEGGCRIVDRHALFLHLKSPCQQISYMSAHDDYSLYDQLCMTMPFDGDDVKLTSIKLGAFILFSSLGTPFLLAGEEWARTKKLDKNAYRSGDDVNLLDWTRRGQYDELVRFYRGLISIRKHNPVFADQKHAHEHFEWLPHHNEYGVLAYRIGKIIYCVNPTLAPAEIDLSRFGKLRVLADWNRADYLRDDSFVQGTATVWQRNMLALEICGDPDEKTDDDPCRTLDAARTR